MLQPTPEDLETLRSWRMTTDPLASIKEFRRSHLWLRWLKPWNMYMHYVYKRRRSRMAKSSPDMQEYYSTARIPLEEYKWEYLKLRKSWFIVPLNWDRFAGRDSSRILDLGCGDGDVTQRVADAISAEWDHSSEAHPIEITGIDLNGSRIANATRLCKTPREEISIKFVQGDVMEDLQFDDAHFDYSLCTGVLEILDDPSADTLIRNLCRVTKTAIYVEDLADRYPGGYPRNDLDAMFRQYGFKVVKHHWVLTEPFSMLRVPDPCARQMTWPIQKDQILWIERT